MTYDEAEATFSLFIVTAIWFPIEYLLSASFESSKHHPAARRAWKKWRRALKMA
jgi:hypothetical protein